MSAPACWALLVYLGVLLALAWPLGNYIGDVYRGRSTALERWLGGAERRIYRLAGLVCDDAGHPREMSWQQYARAVLSVSVVGFASVYLLMRTQGLLPANPQGLPATSPHLAFDTAISFVTNTDWQSYGGETTLSHLTQTLGLGVQNFLSAATGLAVMAAIARGLWRSGAATIGNFWADLVRGVLYVLLPLSCVLALALAAQGVVQSFAPNVPVDLLQPTTTQDGLALTQQVLPIGPAASQVAIKQLGSNGGGFFAVNSAHPFENPTPLSNFLQTLAILLIPAACCFAYGSLVRDRRQGRMLLAAMTAVFLAMLALCLWAESNGNPVLVGMHVDATASTTQCGGNMEGKEARFGVAASALWAVATTAASNGSVNAMHDSFTPLGGLAPMVLMQLGEVIFGGVGSGLYGMLLFVVIAVFVAGLMVGRTPEYLGKKIGPFEVKMAALGVLAPPVCVLIGTALAVGLPAGRAGIQDPGMHGF